MLKSSVFEWSGPFENRTKWRPFCFLPIRKPNFETFGFRMDSVFECSEFEPPLYLPQEVFTLIRLSGFGLMALSHIRLPFKNETI